MSFNKIYLLTLKVALGPEVSDSEPENAQPVQLAEDVLFERE